MRNKVIPAAMLSLASLGLLGGCTTHLAQTPSPVKIITAQAARCYRFAGTLEGTSSLTGIWENTGYRNALNEVLNKAAAAGADFIVIDKDRSVHSYWTWSEVVFATAYKGPPKQGCSEATGQAQAPHAEVWE